jgi:hypothetical protein
MMMLRSHPLWRGFWLAAVLAAGLVLMGFTDCLAALRLERRAVAFCGAVVVGAFLGALPGRLHKGVKSAQRTTWQRCLRAFLGGCGLSLAVKLAGDGRLFSAFLTGSAGAWGFALCALVSGFATVRIMGRCA